MFIYELHLAFKQGRDNLDSETYPDLPIEQVDHCLNVAAQRFVKQRYGGNNPKRTGFEETQKRADDLSSEVVYSTLDPQGEDYFEGNGFSTTRFILPADYWFAVVERVRLRLPDCTKKQPKNLDCLTDAQINQYYIKRTVGVDARQHNQINALLADPFNKPEGEYVFRVMHDDKSIQLFHEDKTLVSEYELGYIRKLKLLRNGTSYQTVNPNAVRYWQTTEYWLNDHVHQEVVDLAVKYSLELTESQLRYQTDTAETLNQE